MSTPTATPRTDAKPCQATPFADLRQQIMDSRVPKNEREWWASRTIEKLETELAAAKAECNRLYESSPTALDALTAELARLRADLERFTGHGLLDCHAICDQRDAAVAERDRLRAELADEKNLHTQTRTVVEELNTICTDLRNAGGPPFIRSEAIRLLREDQVTLRAEVERLTKQIKDDNRAYGCELRDPNGTIWEQAAKDHARACAERAYMERLKKQIRDDNLGYACEL